MKLHESSWPQRVPHRITVPATSLWDNLAISARRYPDKPATVFFGSTLTWAELKRAAEALAGRLQALGVAQGDRVLVHMQNTPQLVVAHFAVMRANAVVVPGNPMLRAEEISHYLADAGVRLAITTADLAPTLVAASQQLPPEQRLAHLIVSRYADAFDASAQDEGHVPAHWRPWLLDNSPLPDLLGGRVHGWQEALAAGDVPGECTVGPDDLVALPYTSGTTGRPKGCMHTHRSFMHQAAAVNLWSTITTETRMLVVVPMFHITGLAAVMHACIYGGATMIIMPRWDRELAGRLISEWGVTNWINIPTMVIDLLGSPNFARFDVSSLQSISGGGAAMPQAVAQRLLDTYGLRYCEGYGLTETASVSHQNPPDHAKLQCLGIPFIGTDSIVVDPVTLQELPQGEVGEIAIHGPQVFRGYWQQPPATEEAFFQHQGKQFFRTGDMGRVDEEGFFFLTDRLKRMINASGYNVWPAEVESVMFKHEAIQEVCVIRVADDYRGETVKAVVVLRSGQQGKVSGQDIMDWCREHMAAYKVPRIIQFVDQLPKSGSGKVLWRVLQDAERATA